MAELPAFQLSEKAYRSISGTVYFVFLKREEQDCSSPHAIFLNLVFPAWQLRKTSGIEGKIINLMYALGSALEKSPV